MLFYQQNVPTELMGRFVSMLAMVFAIGRLVGFKIFERLFSTHNLIYPVIVLVIGMILKMFVHVPFLKLTKKMELTKES